MLVLGFDAGTGHVPTKPIVEILVKFLEHIGFFLRMAFLKDHYLDYEWSKLFVFVFVLRG